MDRARVDQPNAERRARWRVSTGSVRCTWNRLFPRAFCARSAENCTRRFPTRTDRVPASDRHADSGRSEPFPTERLLI